MRFDRHPPLTTLQRVLSGTAFQQLLDEQGRSRPWQAINPAAVAVGDMSTGYSAKMPTYRRAHAVDARLPALQSVRAGLLQSASPTIGLMIFVIQQARDVVAALHRPVDASIAQAALTILTSAWASMAPRFPDRNASGTHQWLARLGAFGIDRSQTLAGLQAYKDAIATGCAYTDSVRCAVTLELAAQALALAFEDIDAHRAGVWEPDSFRSIFAAALLGSGSRLSDHIAPLGPLPQDPARVRVSRGVITLELDFLPAMQAKLWFGTKRLLVTSRADFMAIVGCVLADNPLPREANGDFDIGKFCSDLSSTRFELDAAQLGDLATVAQAFLDGPITQRWRDRLRLTVGWA